MTEQQDALTAAEEAVDRKLFRITGVSHSTLLELEELIVAREAARHRARAAQERQRGWTAAADWLRAEYTGPGIDTAIRRAADRLTTTPPTTD